MKLNQLTRSAGIGVFFLFANLNAQSNKDIIKNYIKSDISFKNASNIDFQILNESKSENLKSQIVDAQQYYQDTPIYKLLAKAVIRDGKVISFNNNFQKTKYNFVDEKIDKTEALSTALRHLSISKTNFQLMDEKDGDLINLPDDKVASSRFYFLKNNTLIPAQLFFINQTKNNLHYSVLISLTDGEVLESNNMLTECQFDHNHFENNEDTRTEHQIHNHFVKSNTKKAVTDATYNIFPFPIEAPTFGSRTIVSNPWDLTASPEGWHSNGNQTFSHTRGNNVFAYVDNNASNSVGFYPTSSTNGVLTFDFPFQESTTLSAYDNKSSAVTNLFYANNMMHDIFYKFGFNEENRNFQANNFDKGGIAGDAVFAEAYDGSGYNNANFAAGYERKVGNNNQVQAPRMQMYLWNYSVAIKQRLFYTDPVLAQRPVVNTGSANFGRQLMETGITGDIAIPTVPNGCTALTSGSLTGKIAMVTHAGCGYNVKAKNVQDAGAIGMIVHRTNANSAINMSVSNVTNVSIPSIMIPKDEGDFITAELNADKQINVNLKDLAVGYKNSSFDNGVIIHEYGHGISNRLTGQGYSCLTNLEQMGEGWSDFFALMLTNSPNANATTGRGIGTYSTNTATTGLGIRQYRYTTDMTINPHTYADTNLTGGQPHAVGEIWATML